MKRLQSRKDLNGYTMMRQVLINLDLTNKDYIWLVTDIEAYPTNEKLNYLMPRISAHRGDHRHYLERIRPA